MQKLNRPSPNLSGTSTPMSKINGNQVNGKKREEKDVAWS
jgi:hypothetical protein